MIQTQGGLVCWFRPVMAVTHSLGNRFQAHSRQFSEALSPKKKERKKKSKRNGIFLPAPWDTSSLPTSPNFGMTLQRYSRHTGKHVPTLKPHLHKSSRLSFTTEFVVQRAGHTDLTALQVTHTHTSCPRREHKAADHF